MDSSSLLRFPYKIAQRLNRPYSRYKTDDSSSTTSTNTTSTTSSHQYYRRSEPLYQEIDDFQLSTDRPSPEDKKTSPLLKRPIKPSPYSGSLISRSIDIMTEEELLVHEEETTIERNTTEFRERCKSSSHLEERITSQLYVSSQNRTSVGSSTYSVNSTTPSMDSSCSVSINEESPSHERTNSDNKSEVMSQIDKQDTSTGILTSVKSDKKFITSKSMDMTTLPHEERNSLTSPIESETYVEMAPVQSIKESLSTPLLSEDNVYVSMSPVTRHKQINYTSHDYYNLRTPNGSTSSLPNLSRHKTSYTNLKESSPIPTTFQDTDEQSKEDIYESVDYTRPVPPPRRKKLQRQYNSVHCSTPPPSSPPQVSPILRHHSFIPSPTRGETPTGRHSEYIRDRTSTSPINVRKSPKRARGRPKGMIFNDDTINEMSTGTQQEQVVVES